MIARDLCLARRTEQMVSPPQVGQFGNQMLKVHTLSASAQKEGISQPGRCVRSQCLVRCEPINARLDLT